MKNLPCIISLLTIVSLALLAACAAISISLPYATIASGIVGISCSAGVFAFLVADYVPNRTRPPIALGVAEPEREVEPASVRQRPVSRLIDLSLDEELTVNLIATLGLRRESATVSRL
jgi:uncharacterized membrane protein